MRKMLSITLTDLRLFVSDRINLILATIMPIVMTLVLGGVFSADAASTSIYVDVIDEDNSPQSQTFIEALRAENSTFVLCPLDYNEESGNCIVEDSDMPFNRESSITRVTESRTSALLVIPAGYGESTANFVPVALPYYAMASGITGDAVLQSIEPVLQELNGATIAARVADGVADRLTGPVFADEDTRAAYVDNAYSTAKTMWDTNEPLVRYVLTTDSEIADEEEANGFGQSVPGMASMFVLFTVLGGMGLLLEEKQQWTLQRLVVMPISRAQIVGGKILARFTTGIIQFIIIFIVGVFVGMNFGSDPLAIVMIMVSYTLCVTALMFTIAPLITTQTQASSITTLIALVLSALGGAWWPLEIVPDFMRVIGHLSPVAWAMKGFTELFFYSGTLADVLLPIGVLSTAAVVLFAIGIRNFSYE